MGNYFSFGYIPKRFFTLILYAFLNSLANHLFFYMHSTLAKDEFQILKDKKVFLLLIRYFGYFLFYFPELFCKNEEKKENIINSKNSVSIPRARTTYYGQLYNFIFNNRKEKTMKCKEIIILIVICVLSLIGDFALMIIPIIIEKNTVKNTDDNNNPNDKFNFMDYDSFLLLFFILFASIFILKKSYYIHQYISIIIIGIIGITRFFFKYIKSSFPTYLYVFAFYLLFSINYSYVFLYLEGLMRVKYFSVYYCSFLMGIVSIPIILLVYLILSSFVYIPLKNDICDDPFYPVKYNNKCYFDYLFNIFEELTFFNYLYSILNAISCGINLILLFSIINRFTIFHFLLVNEIHAFFHNIVDVIEKHKVNHWIIMILNIFEFAVICIFLEIIELNFCDLNYNTNRNIVLRASNESKVNTSEEISSYLEESDENEENDNNNNRELFGISN